VRTNWQCDFSCGDVLPGLWRRKSAFLACPRHVWLYDLEAYPDAHRCILDEQVRLFRIVVCDYTLQPHRVTTLRSETGILRMSMALVITASEVYCCRQSCRRRSSKKPARVEGATPTHRACTVSAFSRRSQFQSEHALHHSAAIASGPCWRYFRVYAPLSLCAARCRAKLHARPFVTCWD